MRGSSLWGYRAIAMAIMALFPARYMSSLRTKSLDAAAGPAGSSEDAGATLVTFDAPQMRASCEVSLSRKSLRFTQ